MFALKRHTRSTLYCTGLVVCQLSRLRCCHLTCYAATWCKLVAWWLLMARGLCLGLSPPALSPTSQTLRSSGWSLMSPYVSSLKQLTQPHICIVSRWWCGENRRLNNECCHGVRSVVRSSEQCGPIRRTSLQPAVVASIAGVWPSSSTPSRVPFSFSSRTTTVAWPAIWAMLSLAQWRAVRPRSPFTHTPASSQPCNNNMRGASERTPCCSVCRPRTGACSYRCPQRLCSVLLEKQLGDIGDSWSAASWSL